DVAAVDEDVAAEIGPLVGLRHRAVEVVRIVEAEREVVLAPRIEQRHAIDALRNLPIALGELRARRARVEQSVDPDAHRRAAVLRPELERALALEREERDRLRRIGGAGAREEIAQTLLDARRELLDHARDLVRLRRRAALARLRGLLGNRRVATGLGRRGYV